jgi:hypothetical protein
MNSEKQKNIEVIEKLIGYFELQVLASYRNEPQKYVIKSDYFTGDIRTAPDYDSEADAKEGYIEIRFGYRTLKDGNLALAIILPDLLEKSKSHIKRWAGFHLENPEWTTEPDERFNNWVRRYIEGSWDVDNGPSFYLEEKIKFINGLTNEIVGMSLYKHEPDENLAYPAAQNTHRYQDAHRDLYGYLIDGLNKECIVLLGKHLGRDIKVEGQRSVKALIKLLPQLENSSTFTTAIELVSNQRGHAAHGVRVPAIKCLAFEQFTKDLFLCHEAIKDVLIALEQGFKIKGEDARKRLEAKKWLPSIGRPAEPHYSIVQISMMVGKTIEKVEYGFRKETQYTHQTEAFIIHFTDGSMMGLYAGCNIGNLMTEENNLKPNDFHVSFIVNWVPEFPLNNKN